MLRQAKRVLLGDLPAFSADPLSFAEERLAGQARPVPVRFANRAVFLVARPDAVKHVLVDAAKDYGKSRYQARLRPLLGDGMITASGRRWAEARTAARPGLTGAELDHGVDLALGLVTRAVARQARSLGAAVDLNELAGQLTMRMAAAALFHHLMDDETALEVYRASRFLHRRITESMMRFIDLDSLLPTAKRARFLATIGRLDQLAAEISREPRGVLAHLAPLQAEHGPAVLRDEIMTLLFAGFETTAQVAAWVLYVLASRPDLVEWLRAEADPLLGGGHDLPARSLRELKRARAVVDEVLRLYPSTWWVAREALRDDELCGVKVAKGSPILIVPWVLHRQPDLWPDPERFEPARFLDRAPAKFTFVPFGVGPRACVGMQLARANVAAIAVLLVSAFDLLPLSGDIGGLRPIGGVTLAAPPGGLRASFHLRGRSKGG